MSQTKKGAAKARQTKIDKFGSYEAYIEHYREIGRKGGKVKSSSKGFAYDREKASEAGRKGGLATWRNRNA